MPDLIRRIRQRKIVQWLIVYVTGAWAVSEVIDTMLVTFLDLPSIRGILLVSAAFGTPIVAVLAWYHGEKGRQRVSGPELAILTTLFLVLGAVLALFGPSPSTSSSEPVAVEVEVDPAIAVLPPITAGPDAGEIGEQIELLVSTALDIVPGWRGVSARTVRARWNERVVPGQLPDETTSLDIARATRASYAVLPAVTVLPGGSSLRIDADVYDLTSTGGMRRSIQREGPAGDLVGLAEGLATQILGEVLEDAGEIAEIDLSATTSDSPEALREFLRGEVFSRDFQLEDARDAFNRALDFDSSFARAHYRLIEVHAWGSTLSTELMVEHAKLAYENIERLSEREALVVRGLTAADDNEALRLLREATNRYPDDATAWNWLGEEMIHGFASLASAEEIDSVFRRAIALDPGKAGLYPHPVGLLFAELADSARATQLVPAFSEAASGVAGRLIVDDLDPRGAPLALEYAFGDNARREAARIRILEEYGGYSNEGRATVAMLLGHPDHWEGIVLPTLEMDRTAGRDWAAQSSDLFTRRLTAALEGFVQWRGQIRRGISWSDSMDTINARSIHDAAMMGLPIPTDMLHAEFGPGRMPADSTFRLFRATVLAAREDRWQDFERGRSLLDGATRGDSAVERLGLLPAADAWAAYLRGDGEAALELIQPLVAMDGGENRLHVWLLGETYMALERWADAERIFRTGSMDHYFRYFSVLPLVRYRRGQALEELGRTAEAFEAYAYFAHHWADADPELEPLVQDARNAIERLGADRR